MKQNPEQVLAGALKDKIPQARRIAEINDAYHQLKAKSADLLAQPQVAASAVAAQVQRLMLTLSLEDLERAVLLQIRSTAVATVLAECQHALIRTDHADRLWQERHGAEMRSLASQFAPECHRLLTRLLNESEASDARLAASVELEPSDSAQTKYLREKLRGTPETDSWQSATSATQTLFS